MDWPKKEFYWIKDRILYVSIPFTWNLKSVKNHIKQQSFFYDIVVVGGPATFLMPEYFDDIKYVEVRKQYPGILQRINPLATRTTIGCIRKCGFCGVNKIEGKFKELVDWPNLPIICDNNLLAASNNHFDKVIKKLKKLEFADFNQGVDSRLLTKYHADKFAEIKKPIIRLALDGMDYVDDWEKAYNTLRKAGLPKKSIRSYALIGFNSDPEEAWDRCEFIASHGIKPLPMWFHSLSELHKNTVTDYQEKLGWTDYERRLIMQYYYQRGKKRALILKDYEWRLKINKTIAKKIKPIEKQLF